MLDPIHDMPVDRRARAATEFEDFESRETIAVLCELLAHTVYLRDSYKKARCQAADVQWRGLRRLFDRHYQDQIH
jgi:hypothetical protein